ncbi:unnamed protein product [Callosobruchus maculatus]|uniref:Invertebrate defensins family profile domain-containing protein n=1 Tax=Callosobruchus maculatus TaxID=64391 RepID=A0A653CI39_CALMS|nr:unnamed protein product [Callosobruchus maculatus]
MRFLFFIFAIFAVVAIFASAKENGEKPVVDRYSVANGDTDPPLGCDGSDCNSKCRSIGWLGGFCLLGDCWCFKI